MQFHFAKRVRWRLRGALQRCAASLFALAIAAAPPAQAQSVSADSPDAVEAAFLFNFAKFTSWPSISDLDSSIKFCIQQNTINPAAFAGWGKKKIQNRPVRVSFFASPNEPDLDNCAVLYLGRELPEIKVADLVREASANSTLLVSDIEGFGKAGGHIELFLVNRRLRFKVNLAELSKAKLSLGAGVLNLAEIVTTEGPPK
jgi:hypothetical protein